MMRTRHIFPVIVATLLLSIQGCNTSTPKKQDITTASLAGEGLVVARLSTIWPSGIESYMQGNAKLDGISYPDAIQNGYLMATLPSGKHRFDEAFVSGTGLMIGEALRHRGVKSYPINREFTIRPGEVTNLGKLMLIINDKNKNKYVILAVDNRKDAISKLKASEPEIFSKIGPEKIVSEGKFIDETTIGKLRDQFVMMALNQGRGLLERSDSKYIAHSSLGTLVDIHIDKKRKAIVSKKLLDTGIYDPIRPCTTNRGLVACLTYSDSSQKLYVYDGKKLNSSRLPIGRDYQKVVVSDNGRVSALSSDLRMIISDDKGISIQESDRFSISAPEGYGLGSVSNGHDTYFYSSKPPRLLRHSAKNGDISALPEIGDIETIRSLTIGSDALYIMPKNSSLSDSEYYVYRFGASAWEHRKIDTNGCLSMQLLGNKDGTHMSMRCVSGITPVKIETKDGGETWNDVSS